MTYGDPPKILTFSIFGSVCPMKYRLDLRDLREQLEDVSQKDED